MTPSDAALWRALQAFTLDEPGVALSFTARLGRDNAWSPGYAERVVEEYRRFVFLMATSQQPLTPSDQVDQAWHLHLAYSRSYWDDLCHGVLGRPLHHGPTKGGPGEQLSYELAYARTLARYRAAFLHEPPADIWPSVRRRFGEARAFARLDTRSYWVIPKPRFALSARYVLIAAVGAMSLLGCALTSVAFFECFVLFAAFAPVLAGLVLGWQRNRPSHDTQALTAYELSYLADGEARLSAAVVVSFLLRDACTWDGERVHVREDAQPPTDPLEHDVFAKLVSKQPLSTVRCAPAQVRALRARLAARGLLVPAPYAGMARWIMLSVPAAGLLGAMSSVFAREHLLWVVGVAVVVLLLAVLCFPDAFRTQAGKRRLDEAERGWQPSAAPTVHSFALLGWAALASSPYEGLSVALTPPKGDAGGFGVCGGCGGCGGCSGCGG